MISDSNIDHNNSNLISNSNMGKNDEESLISNSTSGIPNRTSLNSEDQKKIDDFIGRANGFRTLYFMSCCAIICFDKPEGGDADELRKAKNACHGVCIRLSFRHLCFGRRSDFSEYPFRTDCFKRYF